MRNPSRRRFCVVTGAGLGAGMLLAGLPACDPGTGGERIGEGSLENGGGTGGNAGGAGGGGGGNAGGGGGGGGGSAGGGGGGGGNADMGGAPGDMATAPACKAGTINAGAASNYTVGGTPKLFSSGNYDIFVYRDSGGLMAVNAACTHSGCPCEVKGSELYCNCHGATFAFDGSKPTSPAYSPLKHVAMCVDASGNVTVDPKTTVSSTTRY